MKADLGFKTSWSVCTRLAIYMKLFNGIDMAHKIANSLPFSARRTK